MRATAAVILVVAAIAAACSVGEPARPAKVDRLFPASVTSSEMASGSRLHTRIWKVGGASVLRDFIDSERGNEPCSFIEDGQWRTGPGPSYFCLPLNAARHDVEQGPYADKDCKTPLALARVDADGGDASYVITRALDACAADPQVFKAGPVVTGFPYFYNGAFCTRSGLSVRTQALLEPVPLASFAQGSERLEDRRDERVASLVLSTLDGARLTVGAFDKLRNEPIRIDEQPGTPLRWIPSRVAFQGAGEVLYESKSCATAIPTKIARDAICPLTSVVTFLDGCGNVGYRELGAPTDGKGLFALDVAAGVCGESSARAGVFTFAGGSAINPSSAFAVARRIEIGNDVVFRRGYAGLSGNVATWGELFDRRANVVCGVVTAIDGAMRCLPKVTASIDAYADDACSRAAFFAPRFGCDPDSDRLTFVRSKSAGEAGSRVYEVTRPITTAWQLDPETLACTPVVPVVPSNGYEVVEAEITRFPVATPE